MNETFDSEDSELKKLDWDEWEEDIHYDITEDDFPGLKFSRVSKVLKGAVVAQVVEWSTSFL